jgi:hypothetical protein
LGVEDSRPELVFTLFLIGVLLVVAIGAVVVFLRLWRKENKGRPRRDFFK